MLQLLGKLLVTAGFACLALASGVLAASTSERSAIMLVAATGAALAWYSLRRGLQRAFLVPLGLTATLALYVYGYMHYVQVNSDYGAFSSSATNFLKPGLGGLPPGSRKFLAINFGLLFPFSLAGGVWTTVAAGALLPNLLGSLGGAEKLGWSTHYHSPYLGFLIFGTILGAAALYRRSRRIALACGALAVVQAATFLMLNPFTPSPLLDLAPKNIRETALGQLVEFSIGTESSEFLVSRANYFRSVATLIPEGSDVSTTEFYMPALYDHGVRTIRFYPLSVGKSKYVVVPYVETEPGKVLYKGHVSYHLPDATEETNQCLTVRLNSTYRVVQLLQEFPGTGTAVLELK